MDTKYIFLDIDGTLVNMKSEMPASAKKALLLAKEKGHKIIISTGRYYEQIYPWLLESFDFDGIIMSSGATVLWGGKEIFHKSFSKEMFLHVVNTMESTGASILYFLGHALGGTQEDYDRICDALVDDGLKREVVVEAYGNITFSDIDKIENVEKGMYGCANIDIDEMKKRLGPAFNVDPFSFNNMPSNWGEITLAEVNKGAAVRFLMDYVGADIRVSVAVGDGGNDVEMLKAAGVGVAMGNADESAKAVADMITDHIDEDGLYNAFVRLGLI